MRGEARLDPQKHRLDSFQSVDLRGSGYNVQKNDIILGRLENKLRQELKSDRARQNSEKLQNAIDGINQARAQLLKTSEGKSAPATSLALLTNSLKAASGSSSDPAMNKLITMLADHMAVQWGDSKKDAVAGNVAAEKHYLQYQGAESSRRNLLELGVGYGVKTSGLAGVVADVRVRREVHTKDSLDHTGAHVHQKTTQNGVRLGAKGTGVAALVSVGASVATGHISGEVYAGGTLQYTKEKGYRKQHGSIAIDGAIGKAQAVAGVTGDLSIDRPQGQMQSAAAAALGLQRRQAGGLNNDLRTAPLAQKKAADQQSLLGAQLMSELNVDVQFAVNKKRQTRTMVEGRATSGSLSAQARIGSDFPVEEIKYNASISAKAILQKNSGEYVKYTPIWDVLKSDNYNKTEKAREKDKKTILLLGKETSKYNTNLFPKGVDLTNATPKQLKDALNTLQADVRNYAAIRHMLDREVSNDSFRRPMKRDLKALSKNYHAHYNGQRNIDKASEFSKNVLLIHAAIGLRLQALEKANHPDATGAGQVLDKANDVILEKLAPYQSDKSMGVTHFSSVAKIDETNTSGELEFQVTGGGKTSIEVRRSVTTEHPDSLRKEDALTLTVALPTVIGPETLKEIAKRLSSQLNTDDLIEVLTKVALSVSPETLTEPKFTIQIKLSRPIESNSGSQQKYTVEYATARKAVKRSAMHASFTAPVALLQAKAKAAKGKTEIVPLSTYYGDMSAKGLLKAYNASKEAASNGQPDTWNEHKANRRASVSALLYNLANQQEPVKTEFDNLFSSLTGDRNNETTENIKEMEEVFNSQLKQLKELHDDPVQAEKILSKLDETLEQVLAEQHAHWREKTLHSGYASEPYRARHRPVL